VPRPSRSRYLFAGIAALVTLAGLSTACSSAVSGHAAAPANRSSAGSSNYGNIRTDPPGTSVVAPTPVAASPAAAAPSPQSPASTSAAPLGQALPLAQSTGSATEVITVVAPSTSSTTATVQAWDKAPGGWVPHGAAIAAHVGSAGLTTHPSESVSATPIGSFALSRAFGYDANPGTSLSYHQTTSADWWISQAGPLYNTMQTCTGSCPFTQGDPNEHLATTRPQYAYAVVIEYNTASVVQGAGSAFFLHVTDGGPTAGCVSIPQPNLVSLMQWLTPAAAPRILIGIS
jgi:L,D-peptidoglycan transpeptidase YkuD (ErfK/YbiS/YcfS/YnhG family)